MLLLMPFCVMSDTVLFRLQRLHCRDRLSTLLLLRMYCVHLLEFVYGIEHDNGLHYHKHTNLYSLCHLGS